MPPCTTKRRITNNLKTKNNQNCQKITLNESPTTTELKKKYSSRLVDRRRWRARAERMCSEVAAGRQGGPTFMCR